MLVLQSFWMGAATAFLALQATSETMAVPVATLLPQLALEDCAAASRQQVSVYRTLTTSDGADVKLTYAPAHEQCSIELDAAGLAAIPALLNTLSKEGWERLPTAESQWAVVNAMWRKSDRLIEVSRWRDMPDGDPSGSIFVMSTGGPAGQTGLSQRQRQLRPLSEALILTVFDLCPRLMRGREADYAEVVRIEPEAILIQEVLADPTQGTIDVRGGDECSILVNGPATPDAIESLATSAQAHGLNRDPTGVLRGGDIQIQTEAREPIPLNWPSWASSDYASVSISVRSNHDQDARQ